MKTLFSNLQELADKEDKEKLEARFLTKEEEQKQKELRKINAKDYLNSVNLLRKQSFFQFLFLQISLLFFSSIGVIYSIIILNYLSILFFSFSLFSVFISLYEKGLFFESKALQESITFYSFVRLEEKRKKATDTYDYLWRLFLILSLIFLIFGVFSGLI